MWNWLFVILSGTLLAQTPAFEVVSVRPRTNNDHGPSIYNCQRFTSAGPLRAVILWAYDIKPYQLVGMPDWDPTVMYDNTGLYMIEARAAGSISRSLLQIRTYNCLQMQVRTFVQLWSSKWDCTWSR